jgi:hypothetical protein
MAGCVASVLVIAPPTKVGWRRALIEANSWLVNHQSISVSCDSFHPPEKFGRTRVEGRSRGEGALKAIQARQREQRGRTPVKAPEALATRTPLPRGPIACEGIGSTVRVV